MCLGFWHCEHSMCVCVSGDALLSQGWMAPPGTGEGTRRDRLCGGAGGLCSCKSITSGIELEFLLTVWVAEGGAIGKLSINFLALLLYVRLIILLPSQGPAPPKLIK